MEAGLIPQSPTGLGMPLPCSLGQLVVVQVLMQLLRVLLWSIGFAKKKRIMTLKCRQGTTKKTVDLNSGGSPGRSCRHNTSRQHASRHVVDTYKGL